MRCLLFIFILTALQMVMMQITKDRELGKQGVICKTGALIV